jgi:PAS domain S-box-containing protein
MTFSPEVHSSMPSTMTVEQLRELLDALPQTVFEMDLAGNLTFINRSAFGAWQVDDEDVRRGLNIFDWIVPDCHEAALADIRRVAAGEAGRAEYQARRKDGTVFPIVVHCCAIVRNGEAVGLRGIAIDGSHAKGTEDALRQNKEARRRSEARLRSLVKNAVFGIYRSTIDGRFLEVNPALVSMLGYASEEELLSVSVPVLYRDPRDRRTLLNRFRHAGLVENVEVEWRRKDGTPIVVRLNGRWVGDDGQPEGFEMIVEDVSDRRALEEELQEARRMGAVGRLAGGVARDFNSTLAAILGYCGLLMEQIPEGDPRRRNAEEITKAAQRASTLTRDLLALSRKPA